MSIMNSTKKDSERKHARSIKVFLKKKNSKGERTSDKHIKRLMKKEGRKVSV